MIPIILSGGSGSRLWPLSREKRPKQFIPVVGDNTLFQSTVLRVSMLDGVESPLVVCNETHRFMVAEELRQLGKKHQGILLEPAARNTAPAIALAALQLVNQKKGDEPLLVLPADHVIYDAKAFQKSVMQAECMAKKGYLVTFGVIPTKAETGYGYIQKAKSAFDGMQDVYPVQRFVEKPAKALAENYLTEGNFLWNSGMFVFKASRYLEELECYQPEVLNACLSAVDSMQHDADFLRLDRSKFSKCPSISIDYAVMEKTSKAAVVKFNADWSDVGVWSAIWDVGKKDRQGNVVKGEVLLFDSSDNMIHSNKRLVSLLGVNNLVVVDTKDALLIANKDRVQEVKKIVDQLKKNNRKEVVEHTEVDRPWGAYDCIDRGNRFQVKRIKVKPGAKLSLQKHHHRAEHWVVVKGTAEVTCEDKTFLLTENQSTYIPLGEVHQLSNPGKVPLELIEVQSGSYLEEDDIVRLEDDYGRTGFNANG